MWNIFYVFNKIQTILFPPRCFVCKKEGEVLCTGCLKRFSKSIDMSDWHTKSTFSFKDKEIKRIIHAIKYNHRKDLVPPIAKAVASELKEDIDSEPLTSGWILVPIPMPVIRKYMRGYNQAQIIAEEISKILSLPVDNDLLARTRNTRRQVQSLTRSERLRNQNNSFKLNKNPKDLNIILVDDVTTTGATISEARKTLMKNGAKNVRAITVAH